MKVIYKVADTFGGDFNGSWIRSHEIEVPDLATEREILIKILNDLAWPIDECSITNCGQAWWDNGNVTVWIEDFEPEPEPEPETTEWEVCDDCIQSLAYGSSDPAWDPPTELASGLYSSEAESYFSWSHCDCCGSTLGGSRNPLITRG